MLNSLQSLVAKIQSTARNDEGATMVEYALILALITVISIALIGSIGTKTSTAFSSVNANF